MARQHLVQLLTVRPEGHAARAEREISDQHDALHAGLQLVAAGRDRDQLDAIAGTQRSGIRSYHPAIASWGSRFGADRPSWPWTSTRQAETESPHRGVPSGPVHLSCLSLPST